MRAHYEAGLNPAHALFASMENLGRSLVTMPAGHRGQLQILRRLFRASQTLPAGSLAREEASYQVSTGRGARCLFYHTLASTFGVCFPYQVGMLRRLVMYRNASVLEEEQQALENRLRTYLPVDDDDDDEDDDDANGGTKVSRPAPTTAVKKVKVALPGGRAWASLRLRVNIMTDTCLFYFPHQTDGSRISKKRPRLSTGMTMRCSVMASSANLHRH